MYKFDDERQAEALEILVEEFGEVAKIKSKIFRYGFEHIGPEQSDTNRRLMEDELGDVMAMIEVLVRQNVVNWGRIHSGKIQKLEKLRIWSDVFNEDHTCDSINAIVCIACTQEQERKEMIEAKCRRRENKT